MKKALLLTLFLPFCCFSQNYVDLLRIGYGQTFNNDFENSDSSTQVRSFEADLTFPIELNKNNVLITGAAFSRNNLQLFPEAEFTSLLSTTLKLGVVSTYNEKWSSTLVLLPKIASDYKNISGDDFYMGAFAILKLKKSENLIYRFGAYASAEAFGIFSTPIFGWYYLSPNGRFEMDMSLPISADMNYCMGATTIGIDYFGIGRSFNITEDNTPEVYVDLSSLDFASYIQFNTLGNSVLLRAKFGYSSNDYEVYPQGQEIDFGLSAFSFGDDRTQLNPKVRGGLFLKFEAIYRFQLKKENEETDSP
ncbi:MAG: hypothetical protein KJO05_05265 [Bacteroidia bacterium]|nr:hypothetical protein [Bacteroidia bacterium]NNF30973.1 hypothetical protein [Flavobacteriaceae bacterium]MBT8274935.1 hypothetical protein [Bacteroidia bacterium]NNJ82618.1 hypothetical protein [Flavobacteriaceae bacterium]NNK53140.1 hypothetical protein [Flavobacteriaceae bacterium]